MANIESLYREYFQKSKVFLYPALEIRKGSNIAPIQTHVSWENKIHVRDKKLICLYLINHTDVTSEAERKMNKRVFGKDEKAYKSFEKMKLLDNKMFDKYINIGEQPPPDRMMVNHLESTEQGVYVFNFDKHDKDWDNFLRGRYSKLTPELKTRIKTFFRPGPGNNNTGNYAYVESFLHPEKYYALYSELLGVSIQVLKDAGELTDAPDMEKEALKVEIKNPTKIIKI